jgi:hypothetical protein
VGAGSNIDDTIYEAVILRSRIGINIEISFNGVTLWITRNQIKTNEIEEAVKEYHKALSKDSVLKFVRV